MTTTSGPEPGDQPHGALPADQGVGAGNDRARLGTGHQHGLGGGQARPVAAGAYTATKHGLIGLTRTAALETAGTGVTINAICPGATRTIMLLRRLQVDAELRGAPVEEVEANITR